MSDNDEDLDYRRPSSSAMQDYRQLDALPVETAIRKLLASLDIEKTRSRKPTEVDIERMREVHEQIHYVIRSKDIDDKRRSKLRTTLPLSNVIREQVYNLRRIPPGNMVEQSYYSRLSEALSKILEKSTDEEYRKVSVMLGVVEGLAEVIVLDVAAFGFPIPHNNEQEPRSSRKQIANALTNLTFGQMNSKRQLCAYPGFIPTVVQIVSGARNLAQAYAGLLRNLSWNTDQEMMVVLAPSVRALAKTFVAAANANDIGTVRATLMALWNLASHSVDNKRHICDEPGCLRHLAAMLRNDDANMVGITESASGILKYVTQYLATTSNHMDIRCLLASQLFHLLSAASLTVISNALGALVHLISKDPDLQAQIVHNSTAMIQLKQLRHSTNDDFRRAARTIMSQLNEQQGYMRYGGGDMSASLGFDSMNHSTMQSRLLPLRGTRNNHASPAFPSGFTSIEQRSCSLPRQFVRPTTAGFAPSPMGGPLPHPLPFDNFASMHQHQQPPNLFVDVNAATDSMPHRVFQAEAEPQHEPVDLQLNGETGLASGLDDSIRGTRCTSVQSLSSNLPTTSGWNSTVETASNSNRMSPVSPSELPDSPTQCSEYIEASRKAAGGTSGGILLPGVDSTPLRGNVITDQMNSPRASGSSRLTGSDTTAIVQDHPTPSFNNRPPFIQTQIRRSEGNDTDDTESSDENLPGPSVDEEDDYAILQTNVRNNLNSEDLLQRSIDRVLPTTSAPPNTAFRPNRVSKNTMKEDDILAKLIEEERPKPQISPRHQNLNITPGVDSPRTAAEADRLLRESIASAMPSGTSTPLRSKNWQGERGPQMASPRSCHQTPATNTIINMRHDRQDFEEDEIDQLMNRRQNQASSSSSSSPTKMEQSATTVRSLLKQTSMEGFSSDEDMVAVDTSLPLDCQDDNEMVIDCSVISNSSRLDDVSSSNTRITPSRSIPPSSDRRSRLPSSASPSTTTRVPSKTRLPKPTTSSTTRTARSPSAPNQIVNGVGRGSKPLIPPKPPSMLATRSAVVTPYNYHKPQDHAEQQKDEDSKEKENTKEKIQSNPNRMLVTTV